MYRGKSGEAGPSGAARDEVPMSGGDVEGDVGGGDGDDRAPPSSETPTIV